MSFITTYTKKYFDPLNVDESLLDIKDIAHALSLICRGNGHVQYFYSVAQHSLACAKEAKARGYSKEVILGCLLHDGSEIDCYSYRREAGLTGRMALFAMLQDQ